MCKLMEMVKQLTKKNIFLLLFFSSNYECEKWICLKLVLNIVTKLTRPGRHELVVWLSEKCENVTISYKAHWQLGQNHSYYFCIFFLTQSTKMFNLFYSSSHSHSQSCRRSHIQFIWNFSIVITIYYPRLES